MMKRSAFKQILLKNASTLALLFSLVQTSPAIAADGLNLEISYENLAVSKEQGEALDQFVSNVLSALPTKLKDSFKRPIVIEFKEFKQLGMAGIGAPPCPGEKVVANYRYGLEPHRLPWQSKYVVEMNEGFLDEIFKGPDASTQYGCGHKTLYRLAVATAIHEIAHHYDSLDIDVTPEAIEMRQSCELEQLDQEARQTEVSRQCRAFLRAGTTVSGRPGFLALMGFIDSPEHVNLRSPDRYEYQNERESFAVNMEYFALDPEFGCRRPNVYQFLANHFGFAPPQRCQENSVVAISSYAAENWRMLRLDPARIYEIHYLLADAGTEAMSRFGHSMFRIVMCSPKRAQVGPDCLKDVDWHIAVSYRANVRGFAIDKVKGLTGKYPSQVYLLRFMDVINEYTLGESRKVLSYPLKLSREQLASTVRQINEEYWQYQNRYFFINNNCATESLNLLRAALPDHPFVVEGPGLTPKGVRNTLLREELLDATPLASPNAIGRYVFPSLFESAKGSYEKLRVIGLPEPQKTLDQLLAMTALERRQLHEAMRAQYSAQAKAISILFLEIEMLCRNRASHVMDKKAATIAQESDFTGIIEIQEQLLPWNLASGGYGIPLGSEAPSKKKLLGILIDFAKLAQEYLKKLRKELSSEASEYEETSKNVATLLANLKSKSSSSISLRHYLTK